MNVNIAGTFLHNLTSGASRSQRSNLTYRGNAKAGRHDWLRLTPAYSLHVVNEILDHVGPDERVLDPFSGTATTTLASLARGISADSVDINPFLVWFGNLKIERFPDEFSGELTAAGRKILASIKRPSRRRQRWTPQLHQIEKWWDGETLDALGELFVVIRDAGIESRLKDLLKIAFCKAMISTSHASFGHQSMSFKKKPAAAARHRMLFDELPEHNRRETVWRLFREGVLDIAQSVESNHPSAKGRVFLGDSRHLDEILPARCYTTVITSPPYPNRMSYIRELRPYMYWLGFLESGRQAGELDWQAIGGTWGSATSNLGKWEPENGPVAHKQFESIAARISQQHDLLGRYVRRYFDDVKAHLWGLKAVMKERGRCFYIVGNSKFYDVLLPVEEIYAAMFEDAGFRDVGWKAIRKRNSKKELFEYVVYAVK